MQLVCKLKNQWVKYDNQWYFLDINGYMQTGWIQDSGNWYYLNKDGIMQQVGFMTKDIGITLKLMEL